MPSAIKVSKHQQHYLSQLFLETWKYRRSSAFGLNSINLKRFNLTIIVNLFGIAKQEKISQLYGIRARHPTCCSYAAIAKQGHNSCLYVENSKVSPRTNMIKVHEPQCMEQRSLPP